MSTRGTRSLMVVTLLLGLLSAIVAAVGLPVTERSFATISGPTQSLMSVTVPFLGVLLVSALGRPVRPVVILRTVAVALRLALLIAVVGVLLCAGVTAMVTSEPVGGRWEHGAVVGVGSVLVQAGAQLVGTGLGLLLRRRVTACLATIVLPLGVWWLLGAVPAFRPAQPWVTLYPSAQHLLAGEMGSTAWVRWLVALAIWGLGLNLLGGLRASRDV